MAGAGRSPTHSPSAKRPSEPAIYSLHDDLLLAIFLLLPSLGSLVRAACSCRRWRRAVASSPGFRLRFNALHPAPPLLGLFFDTAGSGGYVYQHPCVPAFVPIRHSDRDLALAVRRGDFFLTSLNELPDANNIYDCRGGFLLLSIETDDLTVDKFIVFNPLMRATRPDDKSLIPRPPFDSSSYEHDEKLEPRLVCSKEGPALFRIVILCFGEDDDDRTRLCASVFSSEMWEWSLVPWRYVPKSYDDYYISLEDSTMQANGSLYWLHDDQRRIVSLHTVTMEFSFAELPPCIGNDCTYDAGETKDGDTCIVYSDRVNIGVLIHRKDDAGVDRWVLDRLVPMDAELKRLVDDQGPSELFIFAVRDGYAYLSTAAMSGGGEDPMKPCWFMSLCLETMRLEKLFQRTYDCEPHVYIMPWPKCLIGNYGPFALETAPGDTELGVRHEEENNEDQENQSLEAST